MESKKCLICDNVFYKKVNESKSYWENKKYCSKICSLKVTGITKQDQTNNPARNGTMRPWNKDIQYDLVMKKRLNISGLKIGHGLHKGMKFPEKSGKNHPKWNSVDKFCIVCSKSYLVQKYRSEKSKFCSRTCWALGTRGSGSPVFKGEEATKPLRNRIMELPEYIEWRKSVLDRDNWTCQICGFRNKEKQRKKMEVDHVKRYMFIVKENNINTTEQARECRELWDISNGRTLCRECHKKTDTYLNKGRKICHTV